MAEGIAVTLDLAGFDLFEERAQDLLSRAVMEAADAVVDDARSLAPVDTGFLRDHITVHVLDALNAEVESEADYSAYVEFGTSKQSPQPFLTPAIEAEQERFPERVAAALEEAARR